MSTTAVQLPHMNIAAGFTRGQTGWMLYECGIQAFTTSVLSVFFGPYLTELAASAADASGFVHIAGIPVRAGALFAFAISFSVAIQALILPALGAIADRANAAKRYLGGFAAAGALTTSLLFAVPDGGYGGATALFIIANICFGAAGTFYNGLLNAVAAEHERARVSTIAWGAGYVAGGILLAFHIALMGSKDSLGIAENMAVRLCLLTSGLWWAAFTAKSLHILRGVAGVEGKTSALESPKQPTQQMSVRTRLSRTVRSIRKRPQTALFLLAYLLYGDGIQTVTSISAQFGHEELGLSVSFLSMTMLVIQFTAFGGSLLFVRLAAIFGEKRAVMISLAAWNLIILYAFAWLHSPAGFLLSGVAMAVVLGGSQSLSRSLFSRMIPRGHEAEYFGFYAICERGTSWAGPFLFGVALQFTGSYRVAILSLILLFSVGMALLGAVKTETAFSEALVE